MNMYESHEEKKHWRDKISKLTVSFSELFSLWINQENWENLRVLCTIKSMTHDEEKKQKQVKEKSHLPFKTIYQKFQLGCK